MNRRAALEARLKRLEQRQLGNPLKRRIIIGIADIGDDRIVGMMTDGCKLHVPRQAGEELEPFTRRALSIGPRVMFRVYRTPGAAAEHPEAAPWQSEASLA